MKREGREPAGQRSGSEDGEREGRRKKIRFGSQLTAASTEPGRRSEGIRASRLSRNSFRECGLAERGSKSEGRRIFSQHTC